MNDHTSKPTKVAYGLTINPQFQGCLDPLSEAEFNELEKRILEDREIREPIETWRDQIIDGHHRYRIAEKHRLNFHVRCLDFPNEDAAELYIISKQLARRNVTPERMAYLRGRLYNAQKAKKPKHSPSGQFDASVDGRTAAQQIADRTGVSPRTVQRDAKTAEMLDQLSDQERQDHLTGKHKLSRDELRQRTGQEPANDQPVDKPADEANKVLGGMMATIDKLRKRLDEMVGEHVITREFATPLLAELEVPRKRLCSATHGNIDYVAEAIAEAEMENEPDLCSEERMCRANSAIESFCRRIMTDFRAGIKELAETNAWIEDKGRLGTAAQGVRSALTTVRSCKGDQVCPKCNGDGCRICRSTGWVDRATSQQLS